jgi:hypothetical protein
MTAMPARNPASAALDLLPSAMRSIATMAPTTKNAHAVCEK